MKHLIEEWLKENTTVVRAHDGSFRVTLPYKFEFIVSEHPNARDKDFDKAMSEFASNLATHLENAKSGH